MTVNTQPQARVLVTGSRGKSSIVRLLHTAMNALGLDTYARITGVVPRELGPHGVRTISRAAGAHVEEMRWWLRGIPVSAGGIVLENSAISAEFQSLAGRWLRPDVSVLSNTLPDHQELWGTDSASAAEVLVAGIPENTRLVLPSSLASDGYLIALLKHRQCQLIFSSPCNEAGEGYRAVNTGLAVTTMECLELATAPVLEAMLEMPADRYDFHVARCGGAQLAMAFSVNDINSTQKLFRSLQWPENETRLIYNHRADRPGRFQSFIEWLSQAHWREVLIIGDKPRKRPATARYLKIRDEQSLLRLFKPGDRVFGCGNIAGIPLSLAASLGR
jgi:hypothetical protein